MTCYKTKHVVKKLDVSYARQSTFLRNKYKRRSKKCDLYSNLSHGVLRKNRLLKAS